MSDYGDDDDDISFGGYYDSEDEQEVVGEDEDIQLRDEIVVNGHNADEEDVDQEKADAELYDGNEENVEHEHEEELEDEVELEEVQEIPEEKVSSKVVPKSERKSFPYMSKYEYAYIISQRAMAIGNNSPLMYPETKFIHAIDIAREETQMGINPIIIRRPLPNGMIEEWKCNELKLLDYY